MNSKDTQIPLVNVFACVCVFLSVSVQWFHNSTLYFSLIGFAASIHNRFYITDRGLTKILRPAGEMILYVQLDRFWQLCTPMKRDTEQNKEYLHLQEFCMPLLINSVLHTLSVLPLQISSAYIWVWYKGMYTICILFLVPTCFHLMHLFLDLSMLLCSFYSWVVFYCVKCLVTHLFIFLLRNSRTLFSSLGKL